MTPKPKPPATTQGPQQKQPEKKPFKLKAHLTVRPFSDETLFAKLREQAVRNTEPKKEEK